MCKNLDWEEHPLDRGNLAVKMSSDGLGEVFVKVQHCLNKQTHIQLFHEEPNNLCCHGLVPLADMHEGAKIALLLQAPRKEISLIDLYGFQIQLKDLQGYGIVISGLTCR